MPGYQGLTLVKDRPTYNALKALFDQVGALERRIQGLEGRLTALEGQLRGVVTIQEVRVAIASQLEAFKATGATGTIDTTTAQIVTVTQGQVTEIV